MDTLTTAIGNVIKKSIKSNLIKSPKEFTTQKSNSTPQKLSYF